MNNKQFLINEHNTNVILASKSTDTRNHAWCVLDQTKTDGYVFYFYTKKEALNQAYDSWNCLCNTDKKDRTISVYKIDQSNIMDIQLDGSFMVSGYDTIKEYSL